MKDSQKAWWKPHKKDAWLKGWSGRKLVKYRKFLQRYKLNLETEKK